jgi:pimeloyl-ACP methyl ester carboxylesterase
MRLRHARTELELHDLSRRDGPTLLLLHALGGSSADWAEAPALWPGRVCALDFSGHGRSQWVHGSVYYPELLAGDADVALAETGATAIAGAGIGAYVALLLAASRRNQIAAALLLPGRGLNGWGPRPDFDRPLLGLYAPSPSAPLPTGCDPSCCTLERDIRPPEYVANFAAAAQRLLLLDDGGERPPWWSAARRTPPAQSIGGDLRSALGVLAGSLSLRVPPP